MDILLTDEEIKQAVLDEIDKYYGQPWKWTPEAHDKTIALAQLRKVVEWFESKKCVGSCDYGDRLADELREALGEQEVGE